MIDRHVTLLCAPKCAGFVCETSLILTRVYKGNTAGRSTAVKVKYSTGMKMHLAFCV